MDHCICLEDLSHKKTTPTCQINQVYVTTLLCFLSWLILADLIKYDGYHCVSTGTCGIHLCSCYCAISSTLNSKETTCQSLKPGFHQRCKQKCKNKCLHKVIMPKWISTSTSTRKGKNFDPCAHTCTCVYACVEALSIKLIWAVVLVFVLVLVIENQALVNK